MSNNNQENYRIESDSFGEIKVPVEAYYSAQTQRSVENFPICNDHQGHKMPKELIHAMLLVKKACALTNKDLMASDPKSDEFKKFSATLADQITSAIDKILNNFNWFYQHHFPLVVWQTGSGTQSNMNVNEVIASVANEIATGKKGGKSPVHPNDHVNLGQSSNDTFPTAMNIATTLLTYQKLLPSLINFANHLAKKEQEFSSIIKIGRTHTQDATPITLGQEFSAYKVQILNAINAISLAIIPVLNLAQGGTAVGTGINCHKKFADQFALKITEVSELKKIYQDLAKLNICNLKLEDQSQNFSQLLNQKNFSAINDSFHSNANKFFALACNDELVNFSGALNTTAVALMKIANDIRFLASGPRSGLGEISLPENEPGSSIMPGKVNPTQCEALTMISCQVIGNHQAITLGGMNGHFQLNVFRPMIIRNIIESINLIADGVNSFVNNCLTGIIANQQRITDLLNNSLMLVTALNPYIGYDNSAKIAKKAHQEGTTLKQSALDLKLLSEQQFNEWIDPKKMI